MKKFSEFNIDTKTTAFVGKKIDIENVFNTTITVHKFRIVDSKYPKDRGANKCLHLQISIESEFHVLFTISTDLMDQIQQIPANGFPFETKITKENKIYQFN